ncbi:MAG TPA: chorismate synthase [Bacteroidia bacterium]|nr:chorismate synthase [Bacteroidia bacterium]
MAGNSFGTLFKLTTFGESHGTAIGGIIDGCPAGLHLDFEKLRKEMARRKPGQSDVSSPRKENDEFEILSGIFEGKTLGTPIAFMIRNQDYKPSDYEVVKSAFRPSHADFTYHVKYGHRDYRGGGRASARETAARVFAGAVAKQVLDHSNIRIVAYVSQVGPHQLSIPYAQLDLSKIESSPVRCPDEKVSGEMTAYIHTLKTEGDTTGGIIFCVIQNIPAGLGEPVFDKFQADLAKACMSINAAHGFEYGSGFAAAIMKGSEHNDVFEQSAGEVTTSSNHSGGIQGGITNGMDVFFRIAFKPVSTILMPQQTINDSGENITLEMKGRHDPCVVPRAVPIVEAMAAMVTLDHLMRNNSIKIEDFISTK